MNEAVQLIMNNCIELAFTVIAGIATGVIIPKICAYMQTKTDNEELKGVMDELEKTAISAVNYVEQSMVKQLKDDGEWDADGQRKAFHAACDVMIRGLSARTSMLVKEHGVDLSEAVSRYVESAIASSKK